MAIDYKYLQDSMKSIFDSLSQLAKPYNQVVEAVNGMFVDLKVPFAKLAENYQKCIYPMRDIMRQIAALQHNYSGVFADAAEFVNRLDLAEIEKVRGGIREFAEENDVELSEHEDSAQCLTEDIAEIPKQLASKDVSIRKRKSVFLKFISMLIKFGASNVVAILLFLCQPYYQPLGLTAPKNNLIYESVLEAEQIKACEGIEEEIRIVCHDTFLYQSVRLGGIAYRVFVGDIVIVLEKHKTVLKIRDYETGAEGYIRKKYNVTI